MFDCLPQKTPDFILEVTNECFSLLEELKQSYRDKKSREWFERLKWSKQNISVLLNHTNNQKDVPIESIIVGESKYNVQRLKDEIVSLSFMLLRIKNDKCKLSENALKAVKLLNDKFNPKKEEQQE